jgi:hypothetical protein
LEKKYEQQRKRRQGGKKTSPPCAQTHRVLTRRGGQEMASSLHISITRAAMDAAIIELRSSSTLCVAAVARKYELVTVSVRVMRGELQTPQSPVPPTPTNMSPIEDALAEIESLRPTDSICYTNVSKRHGVWRSTLTRRHQAATLSNASKSINQRKLDEQRSKSSCDISPD